MTHIKKINEMMNNKSRKINESYGDDSYIEFFQLCTGMGDLDKFDKLCGDLDYGEDDFKFAMSEIDIDEPEKIARAYYWSIFNNYTHNLVEYNLITQEEEEDIEFSMHPLEFYYKNKEFTTTEELMNLIKKDRAAKRRTRR